MKRPLAVCALVFVVIGPLTAEPAAWPTPPKQDSINDTTKSVTIPKSAVKSSASVEPAKPKKAKLKVKPAEVQGWTASKPAPVDDRAMDKKSAPGVVDFLQPPTWADPEFGKSKESTLPDYMTSSDWNLKPNTDKQPDRVKSSADGGVLSPTDSKSSTNWMVPSVSAKSAPLFAQPVVPVRSFDLGWSTPKFGDGLPAWRMNAPSMDTPLMRFQRNQSDYQTARDGLEKLYQRWAPPKK